MTIHVLLVNDDDAATADIRRALKAGACWPKLAVARSLHEAAAWLEHDTPDLVVAAARLPDGAGISLLGGSPGVPARPLVLLTDHTRQEEGIEAIKAGALNYIVKSEAALANMPTVVEHAVREWAQFQDRRRTVEALRDSEARIRAIVETAVDAILTIDERGIVETFNPAAERIFGYRAAEVIGRNVSMLMPPPYREEHDGYLRNYLTSGVAKIIGIGREIVGQRQDGSIFPMELAVSEMRFGDRRMFTGIVRDISEKHRLQQKIQHQEKMAAVGVLASGVAHEIGNPLASISAVTQMLGRKMTDPYVQGKIALISKHIDRIILIVRQLVDFARPSDYTHKTCDVNAAVADAIEMLRYDKRADTVDFQITLAPDLPPTLGVEGHLTQVVLNLAINALDAMKEVESPRLLATTRCTLTDLGHTIEITVEDNGPGIAPEIENRIFEPFFSTKGVGHGTGLGLAVSQRIIEDHFGRLRLNGRPGQGARFVIELPVRSE